ncbi:MAG TPA: glycosyltransferase [Phycisphaerales bacterium]|nr:glycosyltransferase [Phycisphaerales bacterium]
MGSASTILFAGGGSGGHISPGLAIAERVREQSPMTHALFACSQRAIDREMLDDAGESWVALPASPPSIRPGAAIRFVLNFRASVKIVRGLIAEKNVSHVVALGGFVAAPAVAAARGRVPVTLVNLDAPPGKANRWMAKKCDRVLTAIELPMMPHFAKRVVGLPIRRRAQAPADAHECRARLGLDPAAPVLLVTGASQGATSINELMMELARSHHELFAGWQVLHLAGRGADEPLRQAYAEAGIAALVMPFLHEMGLAWGSADVAISRAGANSVAEADANAVPTVFLPYPHHRDMHQKHNAQPLVDRGGAIMVIDQIAANANAMAMMPVLKRLLGDVEVRAAMRRSLKREGRIDAAEAIAREILGPPVD